MREIKFKAFVKELNKIIPIECIEFKDGKIDHIHLVDGTPLEPNEFELMQYAGLKDKDSIKVYEGYIVRWNRSRGVDDVQNLNLKCNF